MNRSAMPQPPRFHGVPSIDHFEFSLVSHGDGRAEIRMPARERHVQLGGVLHGGVIATLADTAAVYTIFPDLAPDEEMTSIEFKLNFLRAALAGDNPLVASATLIRRGRRVAVSEAVVRQGGEEVARGMFTYLITRAGTAD